MLDAHAHPIDWSRSTITATAAAIIIIISNMPETKLIIFHAFNLNFLNVDVSGLLLFFFILRLQTEVVQPLALSRIVRARLLLCSHFDNCFFSLFARLFLSILSHFTYCALAYIHALWVKLCGDYVFIYVAVVAVEESIVRPKKKMRCAKLTTTQWKNGKRNSENCDIKSFCHINKISYAVHRLDLVHIY